MIRTSLPHLNQPDMIFVLPPTQGSPYSKTMEEITAQPVWNRRGFLKLMGLAGVGLAPFLKAGDVAGKFPAGEVNMKAGFEKESGDLSRRSLPPIDAAVPERVQTATFALG